MNILNKYFKQGWLIKQVHPTLPLIIWNYSQSTQYERKWDEITMQCRGLVTDADGRIVARPFKKFFNLEEDMHISTDKYDVFNKMDGSLIIAFYYDDRWIVATRGSFISDQAIAASKLFSSKDMNVDVTYMFEFTAPWNRIVIDYGSEENLTLLGGVVTKDGTEVSWSHLEEISSLNNFDLVEKFNPIEDYRDFKKMIHDNQEGFVIRFSNGDRCKIKGDEYIRLHKLMTNVSTKSVWEVLSNGDSFESLLKDVPDEFYAKIKSYENSLLENHKEIKNMALSEFDKIKHFEHRKDFAKRASAFKYRNLLFALLDGKEIDSLIWNLIKPDYKKI